MSGDLAAALTDARDLASALGVGAGDFFWASRQIPDMRNRFEAIESAISAHVALGPFLGKFVIGPSGGGPIHTYTLANHLANRVLSGVSSEIALAELLEFVGAPRVDVQTIYCITGASVATSTLLGDCISLSRPEDLPDTPQRRRFFSREIQPSTSGLEMMQETPTAALVWSWSIDPAVIEPPDLLSKIGGADYDSENNAFNRAFAALALSCAGPVQRSHRYHEIAQPGFPGPGQAWNPGLALGMPGREPSVVD